MFAKGIGTPKNCAVATKYLKQIAESSPSISRKLRSGYRRYKSGQYEAALRNYMSAAEAGIELAQSNAAWLLERGNCLNLDKENCVRASVRYWKASTRQGNMEAGLHVGDFHYFGKLGVVLQPKQLQATKNGSSSGVVGNEKSKLTSSNDGSGLKSSSNSDPLSTWWPFMIEYITQPDVWIARSRASLVQMVRTMMRWGKKKQQRKKQNTASTNDNAGVIESSNQNVADEQELSSEKYKSCKADQNAADGTAATACLSDVKRQQHDDANKDSTLRNKTSNSNNIRSTSQSFERDFFSAAQYYRSAAEMGSPRGNYNLGFMYEWGLGLKQDFPLAKRHYDLAADNNPQAELAVQLTLTSMKLHERLVKLCNWWREWNSSNDHTSADSSSSL
eukprot:CAMPEP_0171320250 /NCGR_PEP_ID=MMETSP0816-20121228/102858_1 /TAXON_ID=420281 /ORGANISM="Proboscia inermis, Strain CCAP1064/1" /LENGTH=389 /DNA_ID=CAMNT_0011816881 /DNA_START=95 /DNA_END=1264 /DNA_ORIENTATION=+